MGNRHPSRPEALLIHESATMVSASLPVDREGWLGPSPLLSENNEQVQVRLAIISDTHQQHERLKLPATADVLIHCGDFSRHRSSSRDIQSFNQWLGTLKDRFPHRVVVGGNHDYALSRDKLPNATHVLCDQTANICGLRVHGAPWSPARSILKYRAQAFTLRKSRIREHWALVPREGIDILVTHCPPQHILDDHGLGCPELADCVVHVQPRLHVFGHKHDSRGARVCEWKNGRSTVFLNAASVVGKGRPHTPMKPVVTLAMSRST